jgi:hypothetical protein
LNSEPPLRENKQRTGQSRVSPGPSDLSPLDAAHDEGTITSVSSNPVTLHESLDETSAPDW